MEISFGIDDYLLRADQKDYRVHFLKEKVKTLLGKSQTAREKFEEIMQLKSHMSPFRLHKIRKVEFNRLRDLPSRTK